MLPRESIFLELGVPRQGEYQSAAYREEPANLGNNDPTKKQMVDKTPVPLFYNQDEGKI